MTDKNQIDQEKLAEEWAKALAEEGVLDEDESQEGGAETKGDSDVDQEKLAEEWAKALEEEEIALKEKKQKQKRAFEAQEVTFKDITDEASKATTATRDIEFILDIPLNVSAELGRTKLLINDLLQLGQGSVIELDKLAGEPLEILVNGKLVARGEAVVINEKYGVRLTDIISPMERVKQLG